MSDTLLPELRDLLMRISTHLGTIDGRLNRIEADVAQVTGDVGQLKADVSQMKQEGVQTRIEMATINGKMTNLPNYWQTFSMIFGVLIGLPTIATIGAFAFQHLLK